MKRLLTLITIPALILGKICSQESTAGLASPPGGQPTPSPDRSSPNGQYEWVINESSPVRYQLLDRTSHNVCFTIKCYFADSDRDLAIRYARGVGVYWNRDSNIVALDEPNYRRAGYLYFFYVTDGNVEQIEPNLPVQGDFDEARLCTNQAWLSPSQFSVRQAAKLKGGVYQSNYYIIDFVDPEHPRIEPEAL